MSTKRWSIFAVALVVVAAAAISSAMLAQAAPEQSDAPVTAVDASTQGLLHVFARPRVPTDELPQPTGGDPATPDSLPGEAYALSRRADPPGDGGPVYLWPMRDGACFSAAGVSSCAAAGDIERRGIVPAIYRGTAVGRDATLVAGIARDGIASVTVVLDDDGGQVQAPVRDNAFRVEVSGAPRELRWTAPSGDAAVAELPPLPPEPPKAS